MARVESTGDSRRKANWEARYQAIIDTSAGVFARGGYHATGITELCVANDLGKGALYHYIGSKEDLLAAIHDRVMDEVMAGADRVAEAGGTPSEQLAMLGDELLDVIHRYPDHVWVFLHEFPALTGERAEQFRERRRPTSAGSKAVLQAGVETGEFRDLDPRLTALAWLGMHNYTYLWLKAGGELSARDVAKPFADIFMRGITNPSAEHAELARSGRRVAAVDDDGRTGRPARGLAGQVGVGADQVAGRAEPEGVLVGDGVEGLGREAVVDRRAERAGAHAVDADAVAGVLDGSDLGELNHRRLGGAVGRGVRPGRQARDRRGQDDGARMLRSHDRHRGPDAVHRSEDVDAEGALPVLGRQVVDAAVGGEDAGVADEDVEPAEALDRLRDHGLDLRGVADVRQRCVDGAVHVGQAVDGRLQRRRH